MKIYIRRVRQYENFNNIIKLQAQVANAIDLGQYDSESFDVVLCLGQCIIL